MSLSQSTVVVNRRSIYGRPFLYPLCVYSRRYARLKGRKTLSETDLTEIRGLGLHVVVCVDGIAPTAVA